MLRKVVLMAALLQVSHGVVLKACGDASCQKTQEVPLNKCSPVIDVCTSSTDPIFYTRLMTHDNKGTFDAFLYSNSSCAGASAELSDACGKCISLGDKYFSSVECPGAPAPKEPDTISLTACEGASCRKTQEVQLNKCSKVTDVCSPTPNVPIFYVVVGTASGKFDAKLYSASDSSCAGNSQLLSDECGKCLDIGNGKYHTTVDCSTGGGGGSNTVAIVLAVVGSLLALVIIAVVVYFMVYKKRSTGGEMQQDLQGANYKLAATE